MLSILRLGSLLLAVAVIYGVMRLVATHYGLHDRWLETGEKAYTADDLRDRVKEDTVRAARYVCPVLVPLDLLFLVFLAAALAIVSVMSASVVSWLSNVAWLFVLLPALYAGVDLAEDALLVRMLTWPDTVTPGLVTVVHALTAIKIWAVKLAVAQTALLAVVASVAALLRR